MNTTDPTPPIPPFGDPNQALFNGTGNLSPEVADPRELEQSSPAHQSDRSETGQPR
jgi:hypothetical protein